MRGTRTSVLAIEDDFTTESTVRGSHCIGMGLEQVSWL